MFLGPTYAIAWPMARENVTKKATAALLTFSNTKPSVVGRCQMKQRRRRASRFIGRNLTRARIPANRRDGRHVRTNCIRRVGRGSKTTTSAPTLRSAQRRFETRALDLTILPGRRLVHRRKIFTHSLTFSLTESLNSRRSRGAKSARDYERWGETLPGSGRSCDDSF